MIGLCECGCGQRTNLARQNDRAKGWTRGQPLRFVLGHAPRGKYKRANGIVPTDYRVEDRGYATPCHVWLLNLNNFGYPTCSYRGKPGVYAHRLAYASKHGYWPERLDHLCRVPACVNPDHLEPVTASVNSQRSPLVTRLSHDDVRAIRAADESSYVLAERYGIDPSYAWRIKTRRKRASVPDE